MPCAGILRAPYHVNPPLIARLTWWFVQLSPPSLSHSLLNLLLLRHLFCLGLVVTPLLLTLALLWPRVLYPSLVLLPPVLLCLGCRASYSPPSHLATVLWLLSPLAHLNWLATPAPLLFCCSPPCRSHLYLASCPPCPRLLLPCLVGSLFPSYPSHPLIGWLASHALQTSLG